MLHQKNRDRAGPFRVMDHPSPIAAPSPAQPGQLNNKLPTPEQRAAIHRCRHQILLALPGVCCRIRLRVVRVRLLRKAASLLPLASYTAMLWIVGVIAILAAALAIAAGPPRM